MRLKIKVTLLKFFITSPTIRSLQKWKKNYINWNKGRELYPVRKYPRP